MTALMLAKSEVCMFIGLLTTHLHIFVGLLRDLLMRLGVHCLVAYILVPGPRPPGCALPSTELSGASGARLRG